jgi:hypothetical protein
MKPFFVLILILQFQIISAQIFIKESRNLRFESGIHPEYMLYSGKVWDSIQNDYKENYAAIVDFQPFFGIYPFENRNLSFGLSATYVLSASNKYNLPNLYGGGIYAKYVFSQRLQHRFFKRLRLFTEINYERINYTINESSPIYRMSDIFSFQFSEKGNPFEYSRISFPLGLKFYTGKKVSIEFAGEYVMFLEGDNLFKPQITVSYMFNDFSRSDAPSKEKPEKPEKAEKKQSKEPYFFKRFSIGSSLTYMWDQNKIDYPPGEHLYENYTWNVNFAASINKHLDVGLQFLNIFTSGTHVENTDYQIYGAFAQYDLLANRSPKYAFFLESSINRGDYCSAGPNHLDPYRKNNLWYIGLGCGFEIPLGFITPRLCLDLSVYNYEIINQIKAKYNFTQYIIGLNYKIGKLKK